MNTQTRSEIIAKFKEEIANGKILVGVGAGITAKSSEAGGADMLIIYNSGRYRMAGRGSLAGLLSYGDANQIVVEMGAEVLPVVKHTPVLAGVCGTDPFRVMDIYLKQLKDQGFNGVQNFPTVGLIDGIFRQNLEETGMGYGLEVEMIRKAHELDMLTCPYVFDPEQAKAMAEAGADILVAHMGLTTKGTIGAKTALTLDDCVEKIKAIIAAGRSVRPDIMVICHGGPIAEPSDAAYIIHQIPEIDGFFGASSIERFAAERGVDVHLILPGKPDKWFVYALAKTHYKALISSGVKISEWVPGFTHAKVMIMDGQEAVVGTINLDYRSLYHHFENAVWMRGVDCLPRIEADFQDTLAQCRTVEPTRQSVWQGKKLLHLVGMMLKFIAPLI